MMTTTSSRTDRVLDTVGMVVPAAGPLMLVRYAMARADAARHDDRGASTVEMIIWSGIGLAVALGVGALLYTALRSRATTVGNDIQNNPLPNGG